MSLNKNHVNRASVYCLLSATAKMAALCHVRTDQRRNNATVASTCRWLFLPAQQYPSSNSKCIGSRLNWLESAVALNLISAFHNKESRKTFFPPARDKLSRTHCQQLLHASDATMEETWWLSDSNKACDDNRVPTWYNILYHTAEECSEDVAIVNTRL